MKGYVDEQNNIVFVCPNCGFQKIFDASPFQNRNKNIKIRCKCGNNIEMQIEFRKHYRKQVELFGSAFIKKNQKKCDIIIRNISMQGLRFELLHIYNKYMAIIDVGDIIELEFKLDTQQAEIILKRCIVRDKNENSVGAEFQDDNFSKRLGFYLG